jgi:hypothetical protein
MTGQERHNDFDWGRDFLAKVGCVWCYECEE